MLTNIYTNTHTHIYERNRISRTMHDERDCNLRVTTRIHKNTNELSVCLSVRLPVFSSLFIISEGSGGGTDTIFYKESVFAYEKHKNSQLTVKHTYALETGEQIIIYSLSRE